MSLNQNAKKILAKLRNAEGVVNFEYNPLEHCLRTPSPSVNWAFANVGFGLPFGYGMLLYGPPKGGKSIICNAIIGQLHKDDPEAVAVVFNTEMRGELQTNDAHFKKWGIDKERLIVRDVNQPELIFDFIEHDLNAACQEGLPIKLIIIDSLSGIAGRRFLTASSINTQQIGDQAATIKDGLLRILPVIRKNKIAFIGTAHVRAEMDQKEQMRGKTIKMQAAWAAKHMFEYFCYTEPNKSKEGRVSLAGEEFVDQEIVDFMDKAQKTGHKIRFRVEESSVGVSGRTAEFTLDYSRGIINQYEEIFTLAKNYNIIERPNNVTYTFKDYKWKGLVNCLEAIRDNPELQQELLSLIRLKDANNGHI
jgi:hypothetical protein